MRITSALGYTCYFCSRPFFCSNVYTYCRLRSLQLLLSFFVTGIGTAKGDAVYTPQQSLRTTAVVLVCFPRDRYIACQVCCGEPRAVQEISRQDMTMAPLAHRFQGMTFPTFLKLPEERPSQLLEQVYRSGDEQASMTTSRKPAGTVRQRHYDCAQFSCCR